MRTHVASAAPTDGRPPRIECLESRVLLAGGAEAAPVDAAADPTGPDLTIRFTRRPKGSFVGGTRAGASVAVANRGASRALPTTVTLHLSSDAVLDDGDRELATSGVRNSLKPGRRRVVRFPKFVFPSDLPPGTYHILARVDGADANVEMDETNNVADGGMIALAAPFVDIVPLSLKVRFSYYKGIGVDGLAILTVRNDGNTDFTGPITGTRYLQLIGPVDWGRNFFGTYSEPVSIKRGATKTVRITIWPPTGGGPYRVTLVADAPADPTPGQEASAPVEVIWR